MTTPGSGSANLTLGVDTTPMERGASALDRLETSYKKTRVSLDDLQSSTDRLTQANEANLTSTQRQLLALNALAQAEADAARSKRENAAATEYMSAQGDKLIGRLEDMVKTYGMTKNELLAFRAAELGVTDAAAPHIAALKQMEDATRAYGVVIKQVSEIEKAQADWEKSNRAALDAQRIRSANDAAAQMERTQTILNAQRIRASEDASRQQISIAEKQAIAEIEWANKSAKAKVQILEDLAKYRANPAISADTMNATFPAPAQKDLANYQNYRKEVEATSNAHKSAHGPANSMSEALNNVSFSSARARSELIVLAHEAVQGRFTRIPASMMVLAEYTNAASLMFSGLGVAIITTGIALAAAAVQIGKGTLELNEFSKAMILTNGYAGLTRDTMYELSREMSTTYSTIGNTSEMMMKLADSGKFTKEAIEAISPAMLKFQHLSGQTTEQVVGYFSGMVKFHGKIFNDMQNQTADWAAKANDSYHFLSAAQYEHIRLLALEGRQQEAVVEIGKAFNASLDMQQEKIGLLVASYRGWKIILSETAHWLQEVGKDWFNGKSNSALLDVETKKYETLWKRRMIIEKDLSFTGTYNKKENLAAVDAQLKEQEKLVVSAAQRLQAEQKAAADKAELARVNTVGVNAQREIDYLKANNKTQAQLQQDKINQAVEAAKNVNLSNIATWEANYKGAKNDMDRQRELAIQSGQLEVIDAEELNKIIEGIQAKHRIKTQDGRKQNLQDQIAADKAAYDSTMSAIQKDEELLSKRKKGGDLTDEDYYAELKKARERELIALEAFKSAELATLNKYSSKGANDAAETRKRINDVSRDYELAKQKIKEVMELDKETQDQEADKKYKETILAIETQGAAIDKSLQNEINKQKEANEAIGQSNEGKKLAKGLIDQQTIAQLELDAAFLESVVMQGGFDDKAIAAYTIRLNNIREELGLRKELLGLITEGAAKQAAADIQAAFDKEWKRTSKKIEDDLTSAIVDGGGNGLKKLIRDMKKEFAELVLRPIIQPVADGLASLFNPNATQAASLFGNLSSNSGTSIGGGSVTGGGSSLLGTASNLFSIGKNIYSGFSAGLSSSIGSTIGGYVSSFGNAIGSGYLSSFGTGMGLTTAQAGAYAGTAASAGTAGSAATGGLTAGAGLANAIPIIGWVVSAMMANNSFYKQGWQMDGQATDISKSLLNSTAKGNIFGPIGATATIGINAAETVLKKIGLSGTMASMLSGSALWTRAFGHQKPTIESEGIRGTLTDDGVVNGQNYANILEKGGWFRSDKRYTQTAGLDTDLSNTLGNSFVQMKAITVDFAKTLGVTGNDLSTFTKTFDLVWDKDVSKREEQFTNFVKGLGDDLAKQLIPNIAEFAQQGETASATLERLSNTFQATDAIAAMLGKTSEEAFGGIGLSTDKARERLINLAGGLDALASATASYSANYLSAAEQLDPAVTAVAAAMKELGYSGVTTREQFKDIVSALDLSTDAGASTFISLMKIQDAFAQVAKASEEVRKAQLDLRLQIAEAEEDTATYAALLAEQRGLELAAMDASLRPLQERLWFLQDEKDAMDDAKDARDDYLSDLEDVADKAFDTLQRIVDEQVAALDKEYEIKKDALNLQKDAAEESLKAITTVFDSLTKALDSTEAESDAFNLTRRQSAQSYLKSLLGTDLTKATGLDKALANVAKDSTKYFGTFLDYARDQARTANTIGLLKGESGVKKTADEKQVDLLEKQLEDLDAWHDKETAYYQKMLDNAQKQLDEAKNGVQALLSVSQALSAFQNSLSVLLAGKAGANSPFVVNPDGTVSQPGFNSAAVGSLYQSLLGRAPDQGGFDYWTGLANNGTSLTDISNGIKGSDEYISGNISKMYKDLLGRDADKDGLAYYIAAIKNGGNINDVAKSIYDSDEYTNGHKSYAVGTDFVESNQTANIHRGERILTSMDNRKLTSSVIQQQVQQNAVSVAMGQMAKNMASMETKLTNQNLTLLKHSAKMSQLQNRWDKQGMPIRALDPSKPIEVTSTTP